MLFKAVGADLQSAPLKYGSMIRLNVYTKGWIINPEQKSADCLSAYGWQISTSRCQLLCIFGGAERLKS
jgi:hypothetical protein